MADEVIENLITKLSFKYDDKKLKKFDNFLKDATKGLLKVVAGATAAATGIFLFTKSIAQANDELLGLSKTIGIDIETLQELGYVAELNKGSVDSMNGSLANLAKISSEAARGVGAGVETFGMLGISVTNANGVIKDTDELLLEVSDAISRLNTQSEKLEFAQKLGISDDLLVTIQQGSEAIRRQRREARELGLIFSDDAAQAAGDFNDSLLRLTSIMKGMRNLIATKFMKYFTPLIETFVEWRKQNGKLIKQKLDVFLDKLIFGIKSFFAVGARVIGMVSSLARVMGGWKNTIIAVTGLLVAMNASALLNVLSKFVTLLTFHPEISWLKEIALLNKLRRLVTFDTSQEDKSWLKDVALSNTPSRLVTLEVTQLLRG